MLKLEMIDRAVFCYRDEESGNISIHFNNKYRVYSVYINTFPSV